MRTIFLTAIMTAGIATASAAQAPAPAEQQSERAALIQMKSDLRNLVTAQEAYYADHSAYGAELSELRFRESTGVTITFTVTQNSGWAAESRNVSLPNVVCAIWVNVAEKNRPKVGDGKITGGEGEPVCDKVTPKH